ncbi:MAG: hypothetical protein A2Z25_19275 [Planctomycetes bacterium RBG_16_55_9]|nr:MAG: hypothetical protein A2Z25_19275 [Planctomycetes bacterium RBG_16_55_9]
MESHVRTIVKALSWRCVATVVTIAVAWFITGKWTFATQIGVADTLIKLGVYYLHERTWIRVSFGTLKKPEYEI